MLGGRANRDAEIGTESVSLIVRAIPLRPQGGLIGALVLVRDVTDLRRRDRELVTKDATIREIHHRVKNNLQTVAALLRLQARRMDSADAKAALEEAVRRVGSIAIVHETLSQAVEESVAFDDVADRLGSMVADVGSVGGAGRGSGARAPSACCPRRPRPRSRWCSPSCSRTPSSTATRRRRASPAVRSWSSASRDRGPAAASRSTTTAGAAGRVRPRRLEHAWGSRSWARSWSPSSAAGSRIGPAPSGRGTRAAIDVPLTSRSGLRPVRTRARALRRLSARRSSSLRPPQTPWSCPASRAHARHCSRTSQRRHTCLASSIWRMAGPVLPIGKNSSGSSSRHAERWRQSMAGVSFFRDSLEQRVGASWPREGSRCGRASGHGGHRPTRVAPACRELERYTRAMAGLVGHSGSHDGISRGPRPDAPRLGPWPRARNGGARGRSWGQRCWWGSRGSRWWCSGSWSWPTWTRRGSPWR